MINRIIIITSVTITICILILLLIYILNSFDESIDNSMKNIPKVNDNFTKKINTIIPTDNSEYKVYRGLIDGRIFKDNIYISKSPKLNYSTCAKLSIPDKGYSKNNVSTCNKQIDNNYYHNLPLQYKLSKPVVPYSNCYWNYKRITHGTFDPNKILLSKQVGSEYMKYPYYSDMYTTNRGKLQYNWPDDFDPNKLSIGESLCEPNIVDIPYHCENIDPENPICLLCGSGGKYKTLWKDPKTRPKECIVPMGYNIHLPQDTNDQNKIYTYLPKTTESINWRCNNDNGKVKSLYTPYANYMYSPYSNYKSCNTGIANLPNLVSITREMDKPLYGGRILGDYKNKPFLLNKEMKYNIISEDRCLDKKKLTKKGYDIANYDRLTMECTLQKFGDINANFIIPDILL